MARRGCAARGVLGGSPWEWREIILPRNWLNSFSPMALLVTLTMGAKGPVVAWFPMEVTTRVPAGVRARGGNP